MKTPKSIALPSGRVVALELEPRTTDMAPRRREDRAPLFSEMVALVASGELTLREGVSKVSVADLALADFHTLRAIATKLGWLAEESIEIACRNCEVRMSCAPCAALELGPFVDAELDDPELDATVDFTATHQVRGLGDTRLEAVSVARAAPLHRALVARRLIVSSKVVRAMGIASIDGETRAARLARRLTRCSDRERTALTDLFLDAHYPPRLMSITVCTACGARNDVDAPFDREFERGFDVDPSIGRGPVARELSKNNAISNGESFPDFDRFDACARALAHEHFGEHRDSVTLIVEGGVPACDDGGEPLLGAYVPPYAGDMTMPSRPPEVTVYYRTFRAMWNEDGPYDWEAELRETIEHELEHHEYHLGGHDPMDAEERRAIDEEAAKVIGRRAIVRGRPGAVGALGNDVADFLRRTWPIWLLLVVITLLVTLAER